MENLPLPLKAELEKILLQIAQIAYRSNKRLAKLDTNFSTDDLKYAFVELQRIENLSMACRLLSTQTCSAPNDIDVKAKALLELLKDEIPNDFNYTQDSSEEEPINYNHPITRKSKLSD